LLRKGRFIHKNVAFTLKEAQEQNKESEIFRKQEREILIEYIKQMTCAEKKQNGIEILRYRSINQKQSDLIFYPISSKIQDDLY